MTVESLFLRQETRVHVHACLDRLPAAYRTVLILRDIEDLVSCLASSLAVTP
jgi:DNA-directed RNA polymerase specialized sigma24 family protein